jgi:lipid A 3-O-deacylase
MKRLLALLFGSTVLAAADEPLPEITIRHSTLTVVSENDKYFAGTDRHYTNGFKLTWLGETDLNQSRQFVQLAAKIIPWMDPENVDWHYKVGLALGHNIYTPVDTDTPTLLPNDRPYAGWLYGSILLHAQLKNQLRLVELSLGVVGPSAAGETIQNAWHDVIDVAHGPGLGPSVARRARLPAFVGAPLSHVAVDRTHRVAVRGGPRPPPPRHPR